METEGLADAVGPAEADADMGLAEAVEQCVDACLSGAGFLADRQNEDKVGGVIGYLESGSVVGPTLYFCERVVSLACRFVLQDQGPVDVGADMVDEGAVDNSGRGALEDEEEEKLPLKRPASRGALKRPAAKGPKASKTCKGLSEAEPCVFSTTVVGQAARMHPERSEAHCAFCSRDAFAKASAGPGSKVLQMLKKIHSLGPKNNQKALQRIEDWFGKQRADTYRVKLGVPAMESERPAVLDQHRRLARAGLDEEEQAEYEAAVRKDRRHVRRKVLCPEYKGKHGTLAQDEKELKEVCERFGPLTDVASNDAGLPAPADPIARMVEQWCQRSSWGMREGCHSMQPRPLKPIDLKKAAGTSISKKACTACNKGEYVPQPEDIPVPLRGLKPEIIEALRPLDIHIGAENRALHGYRVHEGMITFAWAPTSVKSKIRALNPEDRDVARAALDYLLGCRQSEYSSFYNQHQKFLEKKGRDAELRDRRQSFRFIEQAGADNCCM